MKKKIIVWTFLIVLISNGLWWTGRMLFNGVTKIPVVSHGFKADYFIKGEGSGKTAVIIMGGDEWGNFWGDRFANEGHAGLSLSYLEEEGASGKLENIPLEYFEKSVDWLRTRSEVDRKKIIVMGSGRYAELALLLAATYTDKIHGVIGVCPGAVSWSNTVLPWNSDEVKPTWTLRGEPVPYITMEKIRPDSSGTIDGMRYWNEGLDDTLQVSKAFIKVEQINGPILLITPMDDQLWPSYRMSEMITGRLDKHVFKHKVRNIIYENAGHRFTLPLHKVLTAEQIDIVIDGKSYGCNLGGTPLGNLKAQLDSRKKVDEFVAAF